MSLFDAIIGIAVLVVFALYVYGMFAKKSMKQIWIEFKEAFK